MDMQSEGKGIAQPQGGQFLSRNSLLGSVSPLLSPPLSHPLLFFEGIHRFHQYGHLEHTAGLRPKGTAQ